MVGVAVHPSTGAVRNILLISSVSSVVPLAGDWNGARSLGPARAVEVAVHPCMAPVEFDMTAAVHTGWTSSRLGPGYHKRPQGCSSERVFERMELEKEGGEGGEGEEDCRILFS